LLGDEFDFREVVPGPAELCASEPGQAWPGACGQPVSVVLGSLVRAHGHAGAGAYDLRLQDRSGPRPGRLCPGVTPGVRRGSFWSAAIFAALDLFLFARIKVRYPKRRGAPPGPRPG